MCPCNVSQLPAKQIQGFLEPLESSEFYQKLPNLLRCNRLDAGARLPMLQLPRCLAAAGVCFKMCNTSLGHSESDMML